MIRRATFRNFKALRELSIDLERFTVLVGPNASGKSSILQGLHLVELLKERPRFPVVMDDTLSDIHTKGAGGPLELGWETEARGYRFRAHPSYPPGQDPPLGDGPPIGWRVERSTRSVRTDDQPSDWVILQTQNGRGPQELPDTEFLRLDAQTMAAPSSSTDERPTIRGDGEGLASALAYLALNQPKAFAELKASFQKLFPFVENLRFHRVRSNRDGQPPHVAEQLLIDYEGAPAVPATQASDGTLIVLGLLAVVYETPGPRVILLDDLDHGLHPMAQGKLVELLRGLLAERPGLQIVATTHSPYMLDEFQANEVRLTTRVANGDIACAPLTAHPDFENWKDEMGSGEFWSLVGERWVGEQRAEVLVP